MRRGRRVGRLEKRHEGRGGGSSVNGNLRSAEIFRREPEIGNLRSTEMIRKERVRQPACEPGFECGDLDVLRHAA